MSAPMSLKDIAFLSGHTHKTINPVLEQLGYVQRTHRGYRLTELGREIAVEVDRGSTVSTYWDATSIVKILPQLKLN
ncbi:hypothetical protein [uncultured Deefgea sp.]|uniref:hypothetical protein n=1 Tax=uncultured Deefgea sp. TaxID=1304914 RepID=UPI0026245262|nr:hypothetical protein [uncultured Deefgea sp.]